MLHLYVDPMAKISSPLQRESASRMPLGPAAHEKSQPPVRRHRVVVLVLAAVLIPMLLGPAADATNTQNKPAPTPDQARQRREEIRRQQARIAADLEPLKATDAELNEALQATNAQVRAQQAKVSDSQRAADEAQRNADRLAAEQARLQKEVDGLKLKVRDRAVSAYVNPQGKVDQEAMLLQTRDLTEAERKKEFVESVTGANDDAVDKLRAARQSLDQTRADSEAAAAEALERKAALDGELSTLKESQAEQQKVKAMVDRRIAGYKAEAAELSAEDQNMQKVIEDAQRRYQAELAAAAERQRQADAAAAQQRAAAARPAPSNGAVSTPGSGGATIAAAPPAPATGAGNGYIWPISPRVSQEFGGGHPGMDLVASIGTPIVASRGGVVISAGWNNGGYGNLVLIDHGGGIVTAYAHQSQIAVSAGTFVNQGQVIGYVGSTGNSTGPHLHFEVRVNGKVQSPRAYVH